MQDDPHTTKHEIKTARPTMKKVVETKEDGRLLIYYTFDAEAQDLAAKHAATAKQGAEQ